MMKIVPITTLQSRMAAASAYGKDQKSENTTRVNRAIEAFRTSEKHRAEAEYWELVATVIAIKMDDSEVNIYCGATLEIQSAFDDVVESLRTDLK